MKKSKMIVFIVVMAMLLATLSACSTTKASFKINFEVDGEQYDSVETRGEEAISLPADPTKEGCVFDGWYFDKDVWEKPLTANSFLDKKLTSDITVYAKWLPNEAQTATYTVTFETNGGSMVEAQKVTDGSFASQPTAPIKEGFVFGGWYKEASFVTQFNFATDKITADTIIYAKWLAIFDLTFETNGGSMVEAQKVTDGSFASQPTAPTKEGFVFGGWYKEASFATAFNFATDKITANTIIYARWLAIFDVTFETNGGSMVEAQKVTDGSFASQPTAPTKEGFVFGGWYKEASFATAFNFATDKITANTIIYARWLAIFDVTFETNGGSLVEAQKVTDGTFASQPTAPTKADVVFGGWYKEANFATQFNFGTDKIIADTTIYAKWLAILDVTFETNGGSVVTAQKVTEGSFASQPTAPTKADVVFGGWYKEANFATQFNFGTDKIIADTTIYAKWVTVYELLTFTFTDSSNSAYSVAKKSGETLPDIIVLPAEYKGKPVVAIGWYAFSGCSSLTSVTFEAGSKLERIGEGAFDGCSSLTSVTIPAGVTSISYYAFRGCSSLTSITIPAGVTSIGYGAFRGCSSLTSVTIPDGVTSIGNEAFRGCSSLTNITFEAGSKLTSIGEHVFRDCSSLTGITIPAGVTSIGDYAFDGCRSLTSITIPASVTSIGYMAFMDCSSLTSVTFEAGSKLTSIGSQAFYDCHSLTSITIPASVTSIAPHAFNGCRSLTSVTIPASVTSIAPGAFSNCSSLASVTILGSVTNIGGGIFSNCSSLTSVTIPASVTSIGMHAFSGCRSLTSITIPAGVTSIGCYAFEDCSSLTIHAEAASEPAGWDSDWKDIDCPVYWRHNNTTTNADYDYVIHNNEVYLTKYKGSVLDVAIPEAIDGKTVVSVGSTFSGNKTIKSVQIPASIISIGGSAFRNCSSLTSITILASVTSIGKYAFRDCSSLTIYVEAVSQPAGWDSDWKSDKCPVVWDSVNNIIASDGYIYAVLEGIRYSLKDRKATVVGQPSTITTANIPETVTFKNLTYSVTSIDRGAFMGCSSLTSVTIPAGVRSIGYEAFRYCSSLTSITIPASVTSISNFAFDGCSSLTIYAEVASKPEGWNSSDCPVVWDSVNNIIASDGYIYAVLEGIRYALKDETATVVRQSSAITTANIPEAITFKNSTYRVTAIGEIAFLGCRSLTNITVESGNANYKSIDGNLYSKDGSTLIQYAVGKTVTSFTIPTGVTIIGSGAFYGCSSLTSVTIPASVTSIGNQAFDSCSSLTSITIPAGVTSISSCAFSDCSRLTSITFEAGSKLTSIDGSAFWFCRSLTSITIPASVTSIGRYAFWGCSSLTIYAEAPIQPAGWSSSWNDSHCPVYWGHKN